MAASMLITKNALLVLLVLFQIFIVGHTQDGFSCVPPRATPSTVNRIRHRLFRMNTPFQISYGGYLASYPECNIRGVKEAVDRGYNAVSVTTAYLNSKEIAMTPNTELNFYNNPRGLNAFEISGDTYSRLSYNSTIAYDNITFRYPEIYRSSFLYEVFETLPHYGGVVFIGIAPQFASAYYVQEKILIKLTINTLKFVLDSYSAWPMVVLFDADIFKALEMGDLARCSHVFGSLYKFSDFIGTDSEAYRFSHEAVPQLRSCTSQFLAGPEYVDFMIKSGSGERVSCVSFTFIDMELAIEYSNPEFTSYIEIVDVIKKSYYTDGTSNYMVGMYVTPYDFKFVAPSYSHSALDQRIRDLVEKQKFDFYTTPLSDAFKD